MVGFIDALESKGLLERRPHPSDRRARALFLTEAGHELLAEALDVAIAFERDLCADFSKPEREQLLAMLGSLGFRLGLPGSWTGAPAHPALPGL